MASKHDYTWMYGIWFVPSKDRDKDFLMQLAIVGGNWQLDYRFRYYAKEGPENPLDPHNQDEKQAYTAKGSDGTNATLQNFLTATKLVISATEVYYGCPCEFILLNCPRGDPKIWIELGARDWTHMKKEKGDEPPQQEEEQATPHQ